MHHYNNNSEFCSKYKAQQYVINVSDKEDIDKELFSSITYTLLPFIFCGFPRRKNQYYDDESWLLDKTTNNDVNTNMPNIYNNTYSFHYNTVNLEISCNSENLLYGIYPLRLINWIVSQIKRKLIYKQSLQLTDKYEFYAEVLGANHPSNKDIEIIDNAFHALADAKISINTGKIKYENISVFNGDVSWLWSSANKWQSTLPISEDFIELANKLACPISKKAQYELYGSELILFNFFMYQNYCLNESNRTFTYHINQLMDLLQMPTIGTISLKNNKYKIIELCNRISKKTNLSLTQEGNGIAVKPNVEALLVQPLKTIKSATGKVILSQKEVNIFTKQYTDLDVARAMFCVQFRINNGLPVDNPKRYMWWFLREKDGKAAKSMYKAGLAIKEAQYKKFKTIPTAGDINNPSQSEMINVLNILLTNNKPNISKLSQWQIPEAKEFYNLLSHHINHYKTYNDSSSLEALQSYTYLVWLIVTQQIIPQQLQKDVDALLQIPQVLKLAEKYKKSRKQLTELEDLSNYLFGVKQNG